MAAHASYTLFLLFEEATNGTGSQLDPTTIQISPVVAVGLTIAIAAVGAILAALANIYSSRQQIRAAEIAYQQKLRENYLENARKHIRSVYMPLARALENLLRVYEDFRKDKEKLPER